MSIKMQLSLKRELQQYYKQKHDQNILSFNILLKIRFIIMISRLSMYFIYSFFSAIQHIFAEKREERSVG